MEAFVKRESTEVNTNTIERACLSHNKVTITAGQRNNITCSRSEKVKHDPAISSDVTNWVFMPVGSSSFAFCKYKINKNTPLLLDTRFSCKHP